MKRPPNAVNTSEQVKKQEFLPNNLREDPKKGITDVGNFTVSLDPALPRFICCGQVLPSFISNPGSRIAVKKFHSWVCFFVTGEIEYLSDKSSSRFVL
jgi:hypothetical protein